MATAMHGHKVAGAARALAAGALLAAASGIGRAQLPSAIAPMPVATRASFAQAASESFGLSMLSTVQTTAVAIRDSTAGASQAYSGSVTLTPTWDLQPTRFVTLYAYVSQPLTNGATVIPATAIEASALGGSGNATGAWLSLGSTVDGHTNAASLTFINVSGKTKVTNGSEAVSVRFRVNTTNLAIVAGTYTGIVTFGARVQ